MGVAGDGVDLTARRPEFFIQVGQILQLRGADEGKVGGIEEEYVPLAQHVRLGDGAEGVVLVALNGKIGDLFLDEGHSI